MIKDALHIVNKGLRDGDFEVVRKFSTNSEDISKKQKNNELDDGRKPGLFYEFSDGARIESEGYGYLYEGERNIYEAVDKNIKDTLMTVKDSYNGLLPIRKKPHLRKNIEDGEVRPDFNIGLEWKELYVLRALDKNDKEVWNYVIKGKDKYSRTLTYSKRYFYPKGRRKEFIHPFDRGHKKAFKEIGPSIFYQNAIIGNIKSGIESYIPVKNEEYYKTLKSLLREEIHDKDSTCCDIIKSIIKNVSIPIIDKCNRNNHKIYICKYCLYPTTEFTDFKVPVCHRCYELIKIDFGKSKLTLEILDAAIRKSIIPKLF